jgi:NADPH:quinone reductase-like Zn-dependent oxidoreductase
MRALVIDGPGEANELRMADVPDPVRVSDEVLVRVVAAGVNPIDAKTRAGRGVSAAIATWPAVLGYDFAGVVEKVPYAAHPLQPGRRVFGMARVPRTTGSYAELVPVSSLSVTAMPESLGFAEAAAVPLAALTAWGLVVETAKAHDGQRMLIHAGSGGVGHFAVQFARYFGVQVVATASAANLDFLRELGAHRVIDYRADRFEDVAGEQDVVIDLIGNVADDTGSRSLQVLRRGGMLVNAPTGSWPTMAEEAGAAGVRATGYNVAPDAGILAVIARLIDDGAVVVHLERELALADGAQAHRLIEAGHVRGKLVLRVAPDPA